MTTASLPQHQDLFLEPRFAVDPTAPDEDEEFDAAYEALPAPTTSAREPERSHHRPRRR
ncbi:hypothetical protein [Streptomyces sp. V2I9]|uniref:hypothetical protein n=1 Tax=unclassified Streptomyces TaxID=2593676 RepID=UPI002780B600|nr:hypothetical protein [Streptomyces sp. V2I9]MDQ0986235.1 hypothetical protein [Streptomyces sp. V2I9]